jgi:hypothetical protein
MCDTCFDQKIIIGLDGRPKHCPSCSVIPAKAGIHTAPALVKAAPRTQTPAAPARVGRYNPAEAQAKLAEFSKFLDEHRDVYALFEQHVLDRLAHKENRIGAKDIFEDIRKKVGSTGGKYDLDNTWAPWFARKAILAHPQLNTVIETRASLADVLLDAAKAVPA